jgi:hypothetical protein
MRFFIAIIVSIFLMPVTSQSQPSTINGQWVATECDAIGKSFIRNITGLIVEFKRDSIKFSGPNLLKDTVNHYSLNGKKLMINGYLFGRVTKINDKEFILITDRKRRTVFTKVPQSNIILNKQYFSSNIFSINQGSETSDSLIYHFSISNENVGSYYSRQIGEKYNSQSIGKWYTNGSLLYLDNSPTQPFIDPLIFQAVSNENSTIKLHKLSYQNTLPIENLFSFKKSSPIKDSIRYKFLTAHTWVTVKVISYATYLDEPLLFENVRHYDSIQDKSLPRYFCDSSSINHDEFQKNKLTFQFNSKGSFRLLEGPKLLVETEWKLSADGHFVILNQGKEENDYIEILKLDEKEIEIGKQDFFYNSVRDHCYEYFYRIRLR